MVVLAWRHSSHLVQGRAPADLGLRIVGTRHDGQMIRLSAPKCTIGSAEGCTLRLHCVGVRPVDCVILRGLCGTVARSWSAKTRLNGHRFGDALLVAGDRLQIGPIEFEVLASTPPGQILVERQDARETEPPPTEFQQQTVFEEEGKMDSTQPQNELEQAQALLEEALGGLQASRESMPTQVTEFDRAGGRQELDPVEVARQAAQNDAAQAELLTERASLAFERQAWEAAQRGAEEELARRESELAQREQRVETIGIQHDEITSRLEQRTAELCQQFAELERQQAAFRAQREASQQQSQTQSQAASSPPAKPQTAPDDGPAQADVLVSNEVNERESQGRQGEPQTQPAGETPTEDEPEAQGVLRAVRTQRVSDEDESIEQYMAALLNRMRGGSDAEVVVVAEPRQTKQKEASPMPPAIDSPAAPIEPVVSRQRVVDVHMAPVEMERRPTTPDAINDLAAMRELANTHARTAIDIHGKRKLLKEVFVNLGFGIGLAVGSLVARGFLPTEQNILRTGCMMAGVASIYWIYKAVAAARELFTSDWAFEVPRWARFQKSPDNEKSP